MGSSPQSANQTTKNKSDMTNKQLLAAYKRELRLAQEQYERTVSDKEKRNIAMYMEYVQMSIDDLTGAIAMGADDIDTLWGYSI